MDETLKSKEEKLITPMGGMVMLFLCIFGILGGIALIIVSGFLIEDDIIAIGVILMILAVFMIVAACICFGGLKVINPNEALVLALFGNYYGTLTKEGFYFVNPFCSTIRPAVTKKEVPATAAQQAAAAQEYMAGRKISLKTLTLNNERQKVNDESGNPIEIGTVVIWRVINPTKAVLNVENYFTYLSTQCDAITRNAARRYPYDTSEGGDEKSLRGSSQEVADIMKLELQEKVKDAGICIMEVRITHLSYAPEIAAAMLQRQQASAIIDARQKIVEGAVSMVEMALQKLSENEIVELDEERKAAMVSNLLVVLCGNKDAQPIVNSGSLY